MIYVYMIQYPQITLMAQKKNSKNKKECNTLEEGFTPSLFFLPGIILP